MHVVTASRKWGVKTSASFVNESVKTVLSDRPTVLSDWYTRLIKKINNQLEDDKKMMRLSKLYIIYIFIIIIKTDTVFLLSFLPRVSMD